MIIFLSSLFVAVGIHFSINSFIYVGTFWLVFDLGRRFVRIIKDSIKYEAM